MKQARCYTWAVIWRYQAPPFIMSIQGSSEVIDIHCLWGMHSEVHTLSRKHLPTSSGQSMQLSSSRRNILQREIPSEVDTVESDDAVFQRP